MEKKCNGCKLTLSIDRYIENDKEYAKCNTCRLKLIKRRDVCEICGIRASFNYSNFKKGIRCNSHKENKMVNVITPKCEKCNKVSASYNYPGEKTKRWCGTCKEPGTILLGIKKCEKCKTKQAYYCSNDNPKPTLCKDCKDPTMLHISNARVKKCITCNNKNASYNNMNESAMYCKDCKLPDMVRIRGKKCEKCKTKTPSYNTISEKAPRFCKSCKEPDMVDVLHARCIICNKVQANFNYSNIHIPSYCIACKLPDMINVKNKNCDECGIKRPSYNYPGIKTAKFCTDCKKPGMINVISKTCDRCKLKYPLFNHPGEKNGKFCDTCKEPDMVDVENKKCKKCGIKRPNFNRDGEKQGILCMMCKEPDMVDVTHARCQIKLCRKRAIYGQPGIGYTHCATHKEEGMLLYPRKQCEYSDIDDCKEIATYGIKIPIHCEEHKLQTEYCLTERKCNNCNNIDVLNKKGICINICANVEKDLLIKKRIKKHEEYINRLLDTEIDLKNSVIQYWHDEIIDKTCTIKRPDFAYHCGSHVVIVEVDENQHKAYKNCGYTAEEKIKGENKRMYEISSIFHGIPVIFIRYNPDYYKDSMGKKGTLTQKKRQDILIQWIKQCFRQSWSNGIFVKYLCYDGFDETNDEFKCINEKEFI